MMQLWINHRKAVLKSGTSFKLTRMNSYFEDQGDYTFEVQLPLAGCRDNQLIFGAVHRVEHLLVPLVGVKYDMRLIAPPLDISGYAQVTNVTDEEVKVQLVAGRSSFARSIEDSDVYVDKISLGNAWSEFSGFSDGADDWTPGYSVEEQTQIFGRLPKDIKGKANVKTMMHGTYGETDCVCFMTYSSTEQKVANPHVITLDMPEYFTDLYGLRLTYDANGDGVEWLPGNTILAPQPYLLDIIKRIIKAVGYNIGNLAEVEESWMKGIFIANSRAGIRREIALPHWTLPDFLKQVQNFLGVVFVVDGKKNVSVLKRSSWYGNNDNAQTLHKVSDDLSTDIDKDGDNKGSSAGNVAYDWPEEDDMLRLPDEVWENAEVIELSTFAAIKNHFDSLKAKDKAKSLYVYKDKQTGYVYAILHRKDNINTYELHRVDQCAPLLRNANSRDIDTALKIMPARMVMAAYQNSRYDAPGDLRAGDRKTGIPILSVSDTVLSVTNYYSVDNAINPKDDAKETAEDEKDKLEVAYYNGDTYYDGNTTYPIPVAVPYVTDETTGFREKPSKLIDKSDRMPNDGVFALNGMIDNTIGGEMSNGASIDTRAEHLFQFVDDIEGDPTVPYLIRGKRYACHKLEFTIDENGINPLKKGYFYEIN